MVEGQFFERVVHASQAATVVVDRDGVITFVSRAAVELFGFAESDLVGHNMIEFVHPDDLEELVVAFASVVETHDESRWPPALVRLVDPDGAIVPIEVSGHGTFDDPAIQGAVYSVHRMDETMFLHEILAALATGEPLHEVLRLVTRMIEVPPLLVEAVVASDLEDGRFRSFASASASPALLEALTRTEAGLPWIAAVAEGTLGTRADATVTLVPDLPAVVRAPLVEAGYLECWATPLVVNGRVAGALVAASRATTLPGTTMRQRMRRARHVCELAFIRRDDEDRLRHAALHDRLTNIPNRARFFDALEHGVGQRGGPLTGVLYLDLDGFKPLNDTYGHAFGDEVLVEVANRINGALRPHDLAARLGGDEFAVLLEGLADDDEAGAIAERLCTVVSAPMDIGGVAATVGVSIGAAIGPTEGDRATLLNAADQAMYEAKRAGKGAVRTVRV